MSRDPEFELTQYASSLSASPVKLRGVAQGVNTHQHRQMSLAARITTNTTYHRRARAYSSRGLHRQRADG